MVEEENISKTEGTTSKYNQGLPQLFRLDGLWQKYHDAMLKGKLTKANWVLDRIFGELSGDTDEKKRKQFYDFMKQISENQRDAGAMYQILLKKETWLHELQNSQGKGTAYIKEEDEDVD